MKQLALIIIIMISTFLAESCIIAKGVDIIDLSSETDWTLTIDSSKEKIQVKVPYGGWNSDRQYTLLDENKDVIDHVTYSRMIRIPENASGKVIKIHFGAVNFGAEIYIDGKKAGEHHSNFTAFDIDITKFVTPGARHKLEIKAYVLNHYRNIKGQYTMPTGYIYDNKFVKYPFGIARKIEMHIYPPIYIYDIFIQPSVNEDLLRCDVWIANSSKKSHKIRLKSNLDSWNKSNFKYPELPEKTLEIAPEDTVRIRVESEWGLGPESYWWPNIPFNESYKAQLHLLDIRLYADDKYILSETKRFGFVEHSEGPYYYTINGIRVNTPADASAVTQGCVYDGYTESDAYKYSSAGKGCQETWKKYMRLGIRAYRTHQEPPTQNILDAADEVGFIIIPETAIRGSHYPQDNKPDNPYYKQHIQDMVRECRNHPSVARYSLSNELHAVPEYLDMALDHDATRPYVFESNTHDKTTRIISEKGHAYVMTHYVDFPKPAQGIYGLGEYAWSTDGINEYASQGKLMRINDICYFSGWSWTNYWPNFLEGWTHDTYAWKQNNHADRTDGIDGWDSPLINYVKKSLHPYLICDKEIELKNRFSPDWPAVVPDFKPGSRHERDIYIFNDGIKGSEFTFKWKTAIDSPDGKVIDHGNENINIRPGFHIKKRLIINTPDIKEDTKKLFLVMNLEKDGETVFEERALYYNITSKEPVNYIEYISEDSVTQGNWRGKYGKEGYDIAGAERKLPGYVNLSFDPESVWVRENDSNDNRALLKFTNNGNTGISRIAAEYSKYGKIAMTIDVGNQYRNVTLYFMSWDRDFRQPIEIANTGQLFYVNNFKNGKYLTFKMRGRITFILGDERNSSLSGIFIDR